MVSRKNISNSAGNLTLHLVGNLNHFIGKVLGKTDYSRNRELEFSQKDVLKVELIKRIEDTRQVIVGTLAKLNEIELDNQYPLKVFDMEMTIGYFLIHLLTHLTYHSGQINYHRRIVGINEESNA